MHDPTLAPIVFQVIQGARRFPCPILTRVKQRQAHQYSSRPLSEQPSARFVNVGGAVTAPLVSTVVGIVDLLLFFDGDTTDFQLAAFFAVTGGFLWHIAFRDQRRRRFQTILPTRNTCVYCAEITAKVFDVRQFRGDPSLDVKLQPGDRIEVPQSFF